MSSKEPKFTAGIQFSKDDNAISITFTKFGEGFLAENNLSADSTNAALSDEGAISEIIASIATKANDLAIKLLDKMKQGEQLTVQIQLIDVPLFPQMLFNDYSAKAPHGLATILAAFGNSKLPKTQKGFYSFVENMNNDDDKKIIDMSSPFNGAMPGILKLNRDEYNDITGHNDTADNKPEAGYAGGRVLRNNVNQTSSVRDTGSGDKHRLE